VTDWVYLDLEDLLAIAAAAVDGDIAVRDYGLLESAAARPAASVFGADAYPDAFTKAAALLHSLATNHPLVDGNKRLAWLATVVFLDLNGHPVTGTDDEIVDLVVAVADGSVREVDKLAEALAGLRGGC
jgi:death-on-curing protein